MYGSPGPGQCAYPVSSSFPIPSAVAGTPLRSGARSVRGTGRLRKIEEVAGVVEESYVGPYTSVGEGCRLVKVEVENSVLMDRVELSNLGVRVFNSLSGSDAVVRGGEGRPRGLKLILGERSGVELRA